ncbi:hypothetical protein ABC345_09705 [Shouchella sp. 1P09AA]|uniref:hypothetical protein n=1 Tax=unclassified Shouchella TaxID=2893065 RepID=UPI0039A2310F
MEAVFLILAIIFFVSALAALISTVLNKGFKSLLRIQDTKWVGLFFAGYVLSFIVFLFIAN